MKKSLFALFVFTLMACGCGKSPVLDEVITMDQVPANILEIAKKELPDIAFDTAFKMKVDGKDVYELKGKNKQGKTREIEVSVTGEILEIE